MKKYLFSLISILFLNVNSFAVENKNSSLENKVVSVEVSVDKEQKSYIISCLGRIKNNSDYIYRNVIPKVLILDTNRNKIEEIILDKIDRINPREEKSIKIEKFINSNKVSPFDIRATLEIANYEEASFLDIANWFLNSQKDKLDTWSIIYNENDFSSDISKRNAAMSVLVSVKEDDILYKQSLELIDKIKYENAINNARTLNYEDALIGFISISNKTEYYNLANKEINEIRSKIIIEKAKNYIKDRKYFQALNLLRSIKENESEYKNAISEINKLNFIVRTAKLQLEKIDIKNKSKDELSVVSAMETNPETILENTPEKNKYTWVFPDYSTFTFEKGNLINYKIYKLN